MDDATTDVRVLATGIALGESPRWHDGAFWMCDWLAGTVLRLDAAGQREVVARVEGMPFSIDWLPDGRLVLATPDGVRAGAEQEPLGACGRGWNEVVVHPSGRVYVDVPGSMPWEDPLPGLLAVVEPDGTDRVVAEDLWFPNGMVVTDGGATLVVAESHADRLTAFTVTDGGDLVDRRTWAETGPGSAPDGICLDREGAIWFASVPGARCVRVAEGGEVLATVEVGQPCFSCVLGGADGRTLHVTANDYDASGVGNGRVLTARVAVGGW
ncbi:SMP-30/gluconolactonase/LRE family protein [Nocardioides litoris]|uniref:SMP-30/gluconolactonase/LRE family protein n=1 Tax=Nocardioides litoris TaxID=1926648 RepID=UPI00111C9933|nr:SMP-30/gluconolactonase/LRE family protein [Nocardioides litoris]